jgi:hypothetical protein
MNQKTVQLLALFGLVYVGTEVTIGGDYMLWSLSYFEFNTWILGWIVTFVHKLRGGGASAGYVSAGFFGGLMVGRLALLWVNHKVNIIYVLLQHNWAEWIADRRTPCYLLVLCPLHRVSQTLPFRFLKVTHHFNRRLELIVWLVPSLLSSAISTALVGLLFGPFYPISACMLSNLVSSLWILQW